MDYEEGNVEIGERYVLNVEIFSFGCLEVDLVVGEIVQKSLITMNYYWSFLRSRVRG